GTRERSGTAWLRGGPGSVVSSVPCGDQPRARRHRSFHQESRSDRVRKAPRDHSGGGERFGGLRAIHPSLRGSPELFAGPDRAVWRSVRRFEALHHGAAREVDVDGDESLVLDRLAYLTFRKPFRLEIRECRELSTAS